MKKENIEIKDKEIIPEIEVIELVCQNTPDWTHGTSGFGNEG